MKKIKYLLGSLLLMPLTACSVYMAAEGNGGVDPTALVKCKTRECLIAQGAKPVSQATNKKGAVVSETFYAKKPTGSAARAVMHGLLDVGTLGIWEVAGTPIEGVANHADGYTLKVYYQKDQDTIKSAKLAG